MRNKRAYQYRFYPTKEQQQILARTFGCVRYVYNWALRLRIDTYKAEKRSLRTTELSSVQEALALDEREWTRPKCGLSHDRDLNAATNILAEGLSVAACGEIARPGRASLDEAGRLSREGGNPLAKACGRMSIKVSALVVI